MEADSSSACCAICGMPLAYDRFVSTDAAAQTRERQAICSHCDSERNGRPISRDDHRDHAWVLDLLLDVYRSGRPITRRLAALTTQAEGIIPARVAALADIINSVPRKRSEARYDGIVLYSGGKDSTYMLLQLAQRDVRICAWMLDQGYQSPSAIDNARRICDRLEIPLVICKPDRRPMDALFRLGFGITTEDQPDLVRSVMTYGSACWPCFATIASQAATFCHDNAVAFCFIGTQKGQNRLDLHGRPVLTGRGLPRVDFLSEKFMMRFRRLAEEKDPEAARLLQTKHCSTVLVPFYELVNKPPLDEQLSAIRDAGWTRPTNTGACSTNCMINELGRQVMRTRYGFDLYQIIDAHERRLGGQSNPEGRGFDGPELDAKAVRRGARMIKLTPEESREFGLGSDDDS